MKIISVKQGKKNFEVSFSNDEVLEVSYDIIAKYNLYSSKEVEEKMFNDIKSDMSILDIYNASLKILNFGDNSRFMLRQKLLKKNYEQPYVEKVLDKLESNNLLDDRTFMIRKIESLINSMYGYYYIKSKIISLGISESLFNTVDFDVYYNQLENALNKLVKKQLKNYSKYPKDKQKYKLQTYLSNRGYTFNSINKALENIN